MTRARELAVMAITLVWWSPTFTLAVIGAAPHVVAIRGRPCRIRRARRLIDRGRADEAKRVLAALRRVGNAVDRWRVGLRP